MPKRNRTLPLQILIAALILLPLAASGHRCDLSVRSSNALYNYSLASPTPKHPHGVLSEDGFYMIAVNGTSLWFQLCDDMIFNHNPPKCFGCQDCGGPSRCGMKCSALVADNVEGYYVCKSIGYASNLEISLIDTKDPHKGVIVKMIANGRENNCSLSVSVLCDPKEAQVPNSFQLLGSCEYATELRHPSACAKVLSVGGGGWGWFGTLMIILLCLLGGYLLVGTIYRFYFLGIHGAQAIPNLEFWLSLPHRARALLGSLAIKLRGLRHGSPGSYAPMSY
ncbi:uncharacterized protein M6B38_211085 [Iris pallida]|uniref:Autophagy-related protein 27 n=1 Tax=Iris pallida TaxID=29817 RepID=A0AAX6E445_IRIPA|nr:uncharacterized protein M6B38_211085 [Iris pallida]